MMRKERDVQIQLKHVGFFFLLLQTEAHTLPPTYFTQLLNFPHNLWNNLTIQWTSLEAYKIIIRGSKYYLFIYQSSASDAKWLEVII